MSDSNIISITPKPTAWLTPLTSIVIIEPVIHDMHAGLHLPEKQKSLEATFIIRGVNKDICPGLSEGDEVLLVDNSSISDQNFQGKKIYYTQRHNIFAKVNRPAAEAIQPA